MYTEKLSVGVFSFSLLSVIAKINAYKQTILSLCLEAVPVLLTPHANINVQKKAIISKHTTKVRLECSPRRKYE